MCLGLDSQSLTHLYIHTHTLSVLGGMLREDRHRVQFAETAKGAVELLVGHPETFDGTWVGSGCMGEGREQMIGFSGCSI